MEARTVLTVPSGKAAAMAQTNRAVLFSSGTLWISSVTDKAIRDGFHSLKDGRAYDNLYRAAAARAEADWLVGMNGTRALTCKYNAQLSCGRVQTPTLAIIAMREEEIRNFSPKEYYGITVQAGDMVWTWKDQK